MSVSKSESKTKKTLLSVLLCVAIGYPFLKHAIVEPWIDRYEGDFAIYHKAAGRLAAGESPYPLAEISQTDRGGSSPIWGEYPYPPLLARLLVPLTPLDVLWAKRIYSGICLAFFFLFMAYHLRRTITSSVERWVAAAVLLGWGPFLYSIRLGQCELLAIPFLTVAWMLLVGIPHPTQTPEDRRKEIAAGVLLGIAAMVRVTPVLMVPALVLAFRWRLTAAFAVGALGALVISGPHTSYVFFTQVMPTMSDVGGMRHCPAFHVLVLHAVDTLAPHTGDPGWWVGNASRIGILASGLFYSGVLLWVFFRRSALRTEHLVLIGCYLAPLFAGKNPHHYTLALFPVLAVSLLFVRRFGDTNRGHRREYICPILWVFALVPCLHYWPPLKLVVDWIGRTLSLWVNTPFVVGNVVLFLVVVFVFSREDARALQ
jgi:hypothetical protein